MREGLSDAADKGYAEKHVPRVVRGPHVPLVEGTRMGPPPRRPSSDEAPVYGRSPSARPRWGAKFHHAFRGAKRGIRGQSSFFIHIFCAMVVVAGAVALDVTLVEWCLFAVCITMVLAAEMFNTALERLAKAISREQHPDIGTALDISSAAVLLTAIGSAVVGVILFLNRILLLFGWPR